MKRKVTMKKQAVYVDDDSEPRAVDISQPSIDDTAKATATGKVAVVNRMERKATLTEKHKLE